MSSKVLIVGSIRFILIALALTAAVTQRFFGVLGGAFILTLMTPSVNH